MTEVLPEGSEIAGYRIERVAGQGGMGVVYVAEHTHLGRRVALKTLSAQYGENREFRDRFVRESRLAARIDHPNIVPIHDAGEVDGVLYLAMKFVDGEDLASLIEREAPLDPKLTLNILGQVAAALDAAHAEGLVHRDVKPGNVLLDRRLRPDGDPRAYLADFGLTKHMAANTALTAAGQVLGTISYVAPEQIQATEVDGRADQYSLGCVLYECLTGAKPFDSDAQLALAVIAAHLSETRPLLSDQRPDLPKALDAVVTRAIASMPEDRFETCQDFIAAAREILLDATGDLPGATPPPPPADTEPSEPPAEREPIPPPAPREATLPPVLREPTPEPTSAPASGDHTVVTSEAALPPTTTHEQPDGERRTRVLVLAAPVVLVVLIVAAIVAWAGGDDPADVGAEEAVAEEAGDEGVGDEGAGDENAEEQPVEAADEDAVEDDEAEAVADEVAPEPEGPIVFASDRDGGEYDIYVVNPDGTGLRNLTNSPGTDDRQANWAPDRSGIVFSSNRSGVFAIYLMDPDGGNVTQLTSGHERGDFDAKISPDGEWVAFSAGLPDTRSIYAIHVEDGRLERLTDDGGDDQRPAWSPDGEMIVFHRVHGDTIDVFVQDVEEGTEPINITQRDDGIDFHPGWSPDGDLIVYAARHDGVDDVFVIDAREAVSGATPDPVNLTETEWSDWDPNWSADGHWIAFESDRDGRSEVYIMRRDGTDVRRVTDSDSSDANPGW